MSLRRRFSDWPLRAKMAVLLMVASLVPLGIVAYLDIRGARERMVANTGELLAARGDYLADRIDSFHRVYQVSVGKLARLPLIFQYCRAGPDESDRLKATLGGVFDAHLGTDSNMRGIVILELTGTVKAGSDGEFLGKNVVAYSDVREALRAGTAISEVRMIESTGGWVSTIAYLAPVLDQEGKPVAVAAMLVRASALWDILRKANELAGSGSFAVLFDHFGIRIGHTFSEDIVFRPAGRLDPATLAAFVAERRFGPRTRELLEDVRPFPAQFDRARAKAPGREVFHGLAPVNGKWNYGVGRRLDTVHWTVFYMVPEQVLGAQLAQMTRQKAGIAGGIILGALAAGAWFSTRILQPVDSLSRATKLIAAGDLTARARIDSADELGRLGANFNSMAGRIERQATALKDAHDELELRVQERTAELGQTTQALRDSERRFRALIENSGDGIALIDDRNRILYLSPSVTAIEGFSPDELIGRNGLENTHPDDRPLVDEAVRQLVAKPGQPIPVLWRRRHKLGHWLWLEGVATNLLHDPAVGAIVTNYRDVTDRRRVEEALRESEELFSKAFRLSPDCVAIVRVPDRTVIKANEALCRLWDSSPEEVIGKPTREYSSWVREEDRVAFMQTVQDKGECLDREAELRLVDDRRLWFNISARLIMFNGEPCILSVMRDVTQRRVAEETAARLAAIVEYSEDAIISKDLMGIVNSWNAGAEKLFGYAADEIVGQSVMRLIPAARLEEETEILSRIRHGKSIRHFETERVRKDGRTIEVSVSVSAIRDQTGKVVGASKVARDISERKRMEANARQLETRLTATLENMDAGFFTVDREWRFTFLNKQAEKLLHRPRTDLLGKVLWEEFRAALGSPSDRYYHYAMAENRAVAFEDHYAPLGAWFEVNAYPSHDGLAVYFRDITERKRTEEALGAERTLLRTLIDLLPDYIYVKDVAGRFLVGNAACARLMGGVAPAELVGKTDADFYPGRLVAEFNRDEQAVIAGRPLIDKEEPFTGRDGERQFILTTKLPLRSKDGKVTGLVGYGRNVTAAKQAEEKIHRLNSELEQRVVERTAQLEAANKELEAFSYSVSHDLRGPLRAVDGFSQAVIEDYAQLLPEEGQRYLQTIREGAQRMGALIDDLLAFARLGRQSVSKRAIDTGRLVGEVLEDLAAQREGRAVEIRTGGLPACLGDPALLKQVWVNLLSNALKYTRNTGQAVVEIGHELQNGETVYFVKDNGTGFDMQYAHKLFGVFQRLHRQEEFEGTGVGLAIVQRVIHRHGGRIWAQAAVDRGATFYFTLGNETKP